MSFLFFGKFLLDFSIRNVFEFFKSKGKILRLLWCKQTDVKSKKIKLKMKEHKDQLKKLNQSLQQATRFDEVLEVSLVSAYTTNFNLTGLKL